MGKIPTAKKLINSKESDGVFLSNGNYYYSEYIDLKKVRKLMIEFAKLHVEAALKEASCKLYDTYHTVCEDGTTKGVFKTQEEALNFANTLNNTTKLYHDWVKVVRLGGGMSIESILNSYPLDKIK
jgi:hypothetical protein